MGDAMMVIPAVCATCGKIWPAELDSQTNVARLPSTWTTVTTGSSDDVTLCGGCGLARTLAALPARRN